MTEKEKLHSINSRESYIVYSEQERQHSRPYRVPNKQTHIDL